MLVKHRNPVQMGLYGQDAAWMSPICGMVSSSLEEDSIWDPDLTEGVRYSAEDRPDFKMSQGRFALHDPEACGQKSARIYFPQLPINFSGK